MRLEKAILVLYMIYTVSACSTPNILTRWKATRERYPFTNIMVVAVVSSTNDSLRTLIEVSIAHDLKKVGYYAASSMQKFGPKGLRDLQQQETYLKLCNEGVDAVLVIALLDETKESQFKTKRSYKYPHNYYYNRIWNYRTLQADLLQADVQGKNRYYWEAVLFNLKTLEAECTVQSNSFSQVNTKKAIAFGTMMTKKMIAEKILSRPEQPVRRGF